MSLKSKLIPELSYSDFFYYSPLFFINRFTAENTFALLLKKPVNVRHEFIFYSQTGSKLKKLSFDSSDLIFSIDLPIIESKDKYLSFTHEIKSIESELLLKNIVGKNKLVSLQNRGYTIFKKTENSIGSSVHGNFGSLCPSNINNSGAKQRALLFSYTPSYEFNYFSKYEIVFNNPTKKNLKIDIKFRNKKFEFDDINLNIKPMGTSYISLKQYKGQISFNSRLPICRPVIFKNTKKEDNDFDVFHS